VFELIHTDICGSFPNESSRGSKCFLTIIDDLSRFSRVCFLKQKSDTSITVHAFFNHFERQFGNKINQIHSDSGREYISNKSKDFSSMTRIIHELPPPYLPESNGIVEHFNQIINAIVHLMTISTPDFPSLWAEADNMGTYLTNRLLHKHLPSSTTHFERFHTKRPTISSLKWFESKCYIHIRVEKCFSRSNYLRRPREARLVGYTSSPKVYRGFIFEDEYVFTTQDLTFWKKTSP
jgi:transposase InsO family protein